MVARNSVGDEGQSGAIESPVPSRAVGADAEFCGLVHFGVGGRFVLAFIPAPPAENTEPLVKRLLEVCAEAELDRGLQRVSGDIWNRRESCAGGVVRFAIPSHIAVVVGG